MKNKTNKLSLWGMSMEKPAKTFYGDADGDGIMNMFDCEPYNKKKQGPQHETYKIIQFNRYGPNRVIKRGLTLEQAQAHTSDPKTSKAGKWFHGYTKE